ncbi:hypothetical protein TNIN_307011 [Trichonephila inaurata madagascariensis]|uniref:Uncharacterized protein n=1 Tax=Trichonephila inaurata madagascariensis TaxID=2747483 RepID=A0A8X6XK55_9ARAC|nr:hypothetical protein TNIN_307011 [Trichonephila inaurata madagascariensis]
MRRTFLGVSCMEVFERRGCRSAGSLLGIKAPEHEYKKDANVRRNAKDGRTYNGRPGAVLKLTFARQMRDVDISRPPDGVGADEFTHQSSVFPGDP